MANYSGVKPCPGCGIKGREKPRSHANKLCYNCSELLDIGKQQKPKLESLKAENLINLSFRQFSLRKRSKERKDRIRCSFESLFYRGDKTKRLGILEDFLRRTGKGIRNLYRRCRSTFTTSLSKGI